MRKKRSLTFKVLTSILVLALILASAFFIYVSKYYKAGSLAASSIKSDSIVKVEENGDIVFTPLSNKKSTGFILYPGAKVEASSYAPLARDIASKGYPVIIAKMKFNLAIFSPNRADDIVERFKDIDTWAIGGHSLGGVMASDYALRSDKINGLVFLASYPKDGVDFTNKNLRVLSIWGSNDKVANLLKVKNAKDFMPKGSEFIEIEGANHAGFSDYGRQKGDGEALISNKEQIDLTSKYIVSFLEKLK